MEETIICDCNDSNCPEEGVESGEVGGHIEDCPCGLCHSEIGKVSPHFKIET